MDFRFRKDNVMLVCQRIYCSWMLVLLGFFVLGTIGCQPREGQKTEQEGHAEETRPVVIAMNYPLASVAYQLAGEWADVQCPVPENEDPAFWTPDDSQITAFQQADLVLLNAAGHEPWRERVSLSPLNLTFTSRGFHDQWIRQDSTVSHQHGPDGEHTHSDFASTTWLDPVLFQEQVYVVGQSLIKLLPEKREEISSRVEKIKEELDQLDQRWKLLTDKLQGRALIASHPVYQYLTKRYGWKMQSLHWEPRQSLSEKEWEQFEQLQKKGKADLMLWEDVPVSETATELEKRQVRVIVIKPLGNGTLEEEILTQMRANLERFEAVLIEK